MGGAELACNPAQGRPDSAKDDDEQLLLFPGSAAAASPTAGSLQSLSTAAAAPAACAGQPAEENCATCSSTFRHKKQGQVHCPGWCCTNPSRTTPECIELQRKVWKQVAKIARQALQKISEFEKQIAKTTGAHM